MTIIDLKKKTIDSCEIDRCRGGYILDRKTRNTVPCRCMRVFRYLKRLIVADIPVEYWPLKLDDLKVPKSYREHVKSFLREHRNVLSHGAGMLFLGSNGIGKTTLMVEIGKHFALVGYKVVYTTVQKFINRKFTDHPLDVADYDVLLIDELDKAYAKSGSDYVPKTFEELVRQIISHNKVTVMATNGTRKDIRELFGNSVFSALKRKIQIVPMKGEDMSDDLQKGWDERIVQPVDLLHENIVEMAMHIGEERTRT